MTDTASDHRTDLSSIVIRLFCLFFVGFVAGAAVYAFEAFPYKYLRNAFEGARAYHRYFFAGDEMRFFLWAPAPGEQRGVTRHDPERAFAGLTLVMSTHAQEARLLDMDGETVHRWARPFSAVWPDPPHVDNPVADDLIFWRAAHLYPNGDILVVYVAEGDTPWGYGLARLDRDSNVVWRYAERVHHDLAVGADGRIYTLAHAVVTEPGGDARIDPPYIDDFVVVLSEDGRELERVSVLDALVRSDYPTAMAMIAGLADGTGDILHTNAVEPVNRAISRGGLRFEPGQVIISLRSLDSIALLDLKTRRVEWMLRSGWRAQHDPDLLPNGHILLFDNQGHLGGGGASRVVEFDPASGETAWEYVGSGDAPFFSSWRGRQQKLPNGNVLITESSRGRLFEVTPDKRTVWEYVNPVRGGPGGGYIPWLVGGQRYARDELPFLSERAAPGGLAPTT